jgi:hypothetical protein
MKVLVMENRDRQTDDDPSHQLFFAEAPDRRQGGQQASRNAAMGSEGRRHSERLRGHQRRSVAAFRGKGSGHPTIRGDTIERAGLYGKLSQLNQSRTSSPETHKFLGFVPSQTV